MNKFYWMAIGLLLGLVNLRAEIKLPALVGDNMVLQQATKVRLWGNDIADNLLYFARGYLIHNLDAYTFHIAVFAIEAEGKETYFPETR